MIFTSTCDPALFDSDVLDDPASNALLEMTLKAMAQNHLPVIDEGSTLPKAIQQKLLQRPKFEMLYGALFHPGGVIRVSIENNRDSQLAEWIDSGSATAVACSEHPFVDCLLASDDTITAMKEEQCNCSKATGLAQFPGCPCCRLEATKPIGGMTKEQFLAEIIRPVVRCAEKVTIIDKIIIRAAFGDANNPSGRPEKNWPSFKKSIQAVYDEWKFGLHAESGLFEIITWPVTHVQKSGKPLLEDDLAEELGRRLAIPFRNLRVMFKNEWRFKADMHDRYLVTNQGIVLGFSKGFDLFSSGTLGTCDVYLRKPDELISRLMSPSNNCGILTP